MKFRKTILFIFLIAVAVFLLVSCDQNKSVYFDVVFDSDGGTQIKTQSILEGKKAQEPVEPIKENYEFLYWCDEETSEKFDFTIEIHKNYKLKAIWKEIKPELTLADLAGTWKGQSEAYGSAVNYTFVINADGTGTAEYEMGGFVSQILMGSFEIKDEKLILNYKNYETDKEFSQMIFTYTDNKLVTDKGIMGEALTLSKYIEPELTLALIAGTWKGQSEAYGSAVNYTFVINADGTGTAEYEMSGFVSKILMGSFEFKDKKLILNYKNYETDTEFSQMVFSYKDEKLITDKGIMGEALTLSKYIEPELTLALIAGTWKGQSEAYGSAVNYTFVINADGTGTAEYEMSGFVSKILMGSFEIKDKKLILNYKNYETDTEFSQMVFSYKDEKLTTDKGIMGEALTLIKVTKLTVTYYSGDDVARIMMSPGDNFIVRECEIPDKMIFDGWYTNKGQLYNENTKVYESIEVYVNYYSEGLEFKEDEVLTYNGSASFVYIAPYYQGQHLNKIGKQCFNESNISEMVIGDGIIEIASHAFYKCKNLRNITISSKLENMGSEAFYGCNFLENVEFRKELPGVFNGYPFIDIDDGGNGVISELNIWVPDGESYLLYRENTYLQEYAAYLFPVQFKSTKEYIILNNILIGYIDIDKNNLNIKLNIPEGVTEIAPYSFYNRKQFIDIFLPEGFIKIGKFAFYNCSQLSHLYMSSTLKEIGDYAFTGFFKGNYLTRLYFPEGFEKIGDGAFLTGFNLKIVSLPSTIKYLGYLSFGSSSRIERFYINSKMPPEIGKYINTSGDISHDIFAYVNTAKTTIYVPFGYYDDGENAGKSIAEVYKNSAGFLNVADYIKAKPEGREVGHYGDGIVSIDLDGCDSLIFTHADGKKETGTYKINGASIEMDLPITGKIRGIYVERAIKFLYNNNNYELSEPDYYYDSYNWANFKLYKNGKGKFDMASYYPTKFDWKIVADKFYITIDGNNKLPQNSDYFGAKTYEGIYNSETNTFKVSFMLNDYMMEFTSSKIEKNFGIGDLEKVYGVYKTYSPNNPDFAIAELNFYGNGIMDITLSGGTNAYKNLTYTVDGNKIIIDWLTYIVEFTLDKDGLLHGDLGGIGNMTYYYCDEVSDSENY